MVLVLHAPPGSAMDIVVDPPAPPPEWTSLHQLVDDSRRFTSMAAGRLKSLPPPHPMSPLAKGKGNKGASAVSAARRARLDEARARAERRRADIERR